MAVTEERTATTAGAMSEALAGFAAHLDEMSVAPLTLSIQGRKIVVHVRGADLDAVGARIGATGAPRRYGSDNIEHQGHFGAFEVEAYGSAVEYDRARHANHCAACGQPVSK